MHISITNTEWVNGILMISWSRGGHIGFIFLEIEKGPVPLAYLATPVII